MVLYPVDHLPLHHDQVVEVHEHVVDLHDGLFQLQDLGVAPLDGHQLVLG